MRRLILISPLLLLSGCQYVQSTLQPQGPAANRIAHMQWLMIILFLIVTAIMWVLIAWAVAKRRGTLAEHAPVDIGGGQGWIVIGGMLIPMIILFFLFVVGMKLLASFPIHQASSQVGLKPEILVVGHQWWWEVHYLNDQPDQQVTTADEIHIPINRPVTIELESRDVIHSFWVPALHGKVDMVPGHPNFIRIEANHIGLYKGQCSTYCGAEHARMKLVVVAQAPDEYQAWLAQQRKPGAEPKTAEAELGKKTFLAGPCILCHQVRGTIAGGRVAPDLTHIGSRKFIAGNSYPNNNAYLEAWITHAQSLKPEAGMPNLTQFDGKQLQALTAYLRQLQ